MSDDLDLSGDGWSSPNTVAGWWFDSGNGPISWRLDVVTLLAVIGESSISEHSQAITASVMCLLPRIIPAPQALLKPSRPVRLPEVTAKMTGVYSGVVLDTVGFFANIIHPLEDHPAFSFKALRITHVDKNTAGGMEVPQVHANGGHELGRLKSVVEKGKSRTGLSDTRSARIPGPPTDDLEAQNKEGVATATGRLPPIDTSVPQPGITKRPTVKDRMQDWVANPTIANNAKRPAIPATLYSPVHILSIFSVFLTIGIIGNAANQHDGTAIIAMFVVSMASSIVGLASWWKPILMNRAHTNKVPEGDVVIRTREGAFILIKCTEEVARELYSGTEECEYRVGGRTYRVLMGLGTFMLMVSVILLGNCTWWSQVFIGASYILLNGLYWCMGLIPKRYFWDLSRYDCQDITPEDSLNAEKRTGPDEREDTKSFTRTLWYAIRETERTAWVKRSGAAPDTPQWNAWLAEAERAARTGDRKWRAVGRKDELMKMTEEQIQLLRMSSPSHEVTEPDPAEQVAPAVQVQPREDRSARYGGNF